VIEPRDFFQHHRDTPLHVRIGVHAPDHLRPQANRRERVPEFVRHAGRDLTDRRQPLFVLERLPQALLVLREPAPATLPLAHQPSRLHRLINRLPAPMHQDRPHPHIIHKNDVSQNIRPRSLIIHDRPAHLHHDHPIEVGRRVEPEDPVERRVALLRAPRPRRPAHRDPNTRAAEERLRAALGTRVRIVRRGRTGSLRVEFQGEAELQRLYELLLRAGRGR